MARRVNVFISYAHEDKRRVRHLARRLARAGVDVWFDARLHPSETWPRRLREEIQQRRVFLFLVTKHTLESRWCRWELYQAARANRLVVPVLFEEGASLPPEIFDVQGVDCTKRRGCADKVLQAIHEALMTEETIYRLRPSPTEKSVGVRGQTLLHRLPKRVPAPPGPRYPVWWERWLLRRWKTALVVMAAIALIALGVGGVYVWLRDGETSVAATGTLTGKESATASALVPPTHTALPAPTASPVAAMSATPSVARICASGTEQAWVREQPLSGSHAFLSIPAGSCMGVWWQFTDESGRTWLFVPEATRGTLNRGGWVAWDAAHVRLEGETSSVFDAVLCEGRVRVYDAGLSTTTNATPRYVSLQLGEHVWVFARESQGGADWYYAAAQHSGNWLFGWIPADQISLLGECSSS